ncbi:MAG: glycosyltransferase family protein [Nitrosopumilus sp.]|nr:glycosyltransferase family protein [Nitrosopumilus sp.]
MIGCIIQARTGSLRLPSKILKKIDQINTVLSFTVKQVKNSKIIQKIVVATTNLPEDDVLLNHTKELRVDYFRGNSFDVLDRYYQCAKKFSFSIIVRITSDCPLVDPIIMDEIISNFEKNKNSLDYSSNVHPNRTFPHGTDVEVFSFETLETAWKEAKKPAEREHVTPYIYNNKKFRLFNLTNQNNLSNFRWTIDYKEDLELIQKIISKIDARPILMNDILELLSKNPELIKINQNIHKEKI